MRKEGDKYIITVDRYSFVISNKDYNYPLGMGSFGVVYRATSDDNTLVAVKKMKKTQDANLKQKILGEISLMLKIFNLPIKENIIYAYQYAEDSDYYYIIMPYYDKGTLATLIYKKEITSEQEAIEYFRQICFGMMVLHSLNIMHRDIKADNILVKSYSNPKYPYNNLLCVADLGINKMFSSSTNTVDVGTSKTKAPEVYTGQYDIKADMYSLGCIYYKMISGIDPFNGSTDGQMLAQKSEKILHIKPLFPLHYLSYFILESCLQYDEKNRISPIELFDTLNISTLYSNYSKMPLGNKSKSTSINMKAGYIPYSPDDMQHSTESGIGMIDIKHRYNEFRCQTHIISNIASIPMPNNKAIATKCSTVCTLLCICLLLSLSTLIVAMEFNHMYADTSTYEKCNTATLQDTRINLFNTKWFRVMKLLLSNITVSNGSYAYKYNPPQKNISQEECVCNLHESTIKSSAHASNKVSNVETTKLPSITMASLNASFNNQSVNTDKRAMPSSNATINNKQNMNNHIPSNKKNNTNTKNKYKL